MRQKGFPGLEPRSSVFRLEQNLVDTPSITLNSTRLTDPDSPLPAYPGRPNRLTLAFANDEPWFAVLDVVMPDGRKRTESQEAHCAKIEFDLGPLAVPAVYEFEAGVVYRRGHRLRVSAYDHAPAESDIPVIRYALHQGCTQDEHAEWFFAGSEERVPYTDGWIPDGQAWNPFEYSGRPMEPPIEVRLDQGVLLDQNDVRVRYRLRANDPKLSRIEGVLVGRNRSEYVCCDPIEVTAEHEWKEVAIDVAGWAPGTYRFELRPKVDAKLWEGPIITYRRTAVDHTQIDVSPLAPYTLTVDTSRPRWEVDDWERIEFPSDRAPNITRSSEGWSLLHVDSFTASHRLNLPFELTGPYAIYVEAAGPIHIDCGDGLIRAATPTAGDPMGLGPVFINTRDMTGSTIQVFGADEGAAIGQVRLVPVTTDSIEAFQTRVRNPIVPLRGISDWWVYFLGSGFRTSYLEQDQFDTILAGQREIGLSSEAWAIGRSWVTYDSKLPRASQYPCHPIPEKTLEVMPNLAAVKRMVNDFDALGYPLKRRASHDTLIYNWLGMNRHYAGARGWSHTSPWVRSHPELLLCNRDGTSDGSRVEYHFEEVRRERIGIILESSRFSPDGLVLGWCRQPPHAGYHPDVVEQYQNETGDDPLTLDPSDGTRHAAWLKWRCENGTTRFMREVRQAMIDLEAETGHRVPIVARVPSEGFYFNMAMGMDVEVWIRERLIDELQLDPLENRGGGCAEVGSQDVTPYVDLCRRHGVIVLGGVNGSTATRDLSRSTVEGPDYAPPVGLRRAIGLAEAGVDGIEIYESELFAYASHARWLVPLFGSPSDAEAFLANSNIESVYSITASNAVRGHDNHWSTGHCLYRQEADVRGVQHFI